MGSRPAASASTYRVVFGLASAFAPMTLFPHPRTRRLHHAVLRCSLALGPLCLAACSTAPVAPLPTVAAVDLARYTGAWYEVAMLPNFFQSRCVSDTQANYRSRDGDIEVINRCRQADGSLTSAQGVAKVVAGSANAKLRVSFFRPFYGDYWVLALPQDYRWVLVGEPGRQYGWVLSRTPAMAAGDLKEALDRAEALGYRRADFRFTPQTQALPAAAALP